MEILQFCTKPLKCFIENLNESYQLVYGREMAGENDVEY